MEQSSASATRGSRSHETGCVALIQAHGERHPQSAKRSTIHTPNYNIFSIMYTPAPARQRGSRSHEAGCVALIQAHSERHPQSAKRSTTHTPNYKSPSSSDTTDSTEFFNSTYKIIYIRRDHFEYQKQ